MRKHALFQGRFQPPTIAHFSTLLAILENWKEVTIGIVYFLKKPPKVEGLGEAFAEKIRVPKRAQNPFTLEERLELWNACLRNTRLENRVSCKACKPPLYDDQLNKLYSPDKVDYVLPKSEPSETDDFEREQLFPSLLNRDIHFVYPKQKIHVSQIRMMVQKPDDWKQFLAPGTEEVFARIGGYTRMAP